MGRADGAGPDSQRPSGSEAGSAEPAGCRQSGRGAVPGGCVFRCCATGSRASCGTVGTYGRIVIQQQRTKAVAVCPSSYLTFWHAPTVHSGGRRRKWSTVQIAHDADNMIQDTQGPAQGVPQRGRSASRVTESALQVSTCGHACVGHASGAWQRQVHSVFLHIMPARQPRRAAA